MWYIDGKVCQDLVFVSVGLVPQSCLCSGQQESRGIAPKERETATVESVIPVCIGSNTFIFIPVNSLIKQCQFRSLLSEFPAPNYS